VAPRAHAGGRRPRIVPEQLDRAAGRSRQAEHRLDRRGLAGAVGSEDRGDAAGRDLEIDAVEGGHVAAAMDDALQADGRVGVGA
jgi:hypothetical protein